MIIDDFLYFLKILEKSRAFPLVIATGGDAETLFSDSDLVTRVVPDLVLRGILVTVRAAAEAE